MNIQSISKENANANVTLSASELDLICNMFHEQLAKEKSNPKFLELYGDLMLARDLCQYGHVDNFCLGGIVKCRNSIGNGVNGDRKSTRLNSSHIEESRMPSSA